VAHQNVAAMSTLQPAHRGLTSAELALALGELHAQLAGSTVLDAVLVQPGEDLLLVLARDDQKHFVHIALGSKRARIATTARRFGKHERVLGPKVDALKKHLDGRTLELVVVPAPGERRARLSFSGGVRLEVELFSARGLWALVDGAGLILDLSRPVATAVRTLHLGEAYAPPPPSPASAAALEPPPRFAAPVLEAIDAHYAPMDAAAAAAADRELLRLAAARAVTRLQQKVEGLRTQLAESTRIDALRQEADLLLAYAHAVPRGAGSVEVPDPFTGEPRCIELDPALPVTVQAQRRYDRARRMAEGVQIAEQRLAQTEAELATALPVRDALAASTGVSAEDLAALRAQLIELGALPKPKAAKQPQEKKDRRIQGENLRRFVSAEGYEVLVGRDNEQNDRLTLRIANGNDIWLHVGSGRPGSHVVVRLPKGKTASLDTLLDAGTLAVHFSKARGERTVDVIYTLAKNVRKPKGLPPGAVVPSQQKSLNVRLDESRLRRLLDSAGESG
jgi:predicted ribosome quality control (RQC) complex YloA/Tae2 family protein